MHGINESIFHFNVIHGPYLKRKIDSYFASYILDKSLTTNNNYNVFRRNIIIITSNFETEATKTDHEATTTKTNRRKTERDE